MEKLKIAVFLVFAFCCSLSAECQESGSRNKIKSITVLEQKSDVLISKQYKESETFFDSKGNIIEEIKYKQGKITSHFKYQYDNDGNKIREEQFDPSGNIRESSEYKYENGLRIQKIVYDSNNKVKSTKIYRYTTY